MRFKSKSVVLIILSLLVLFVAGCGRSAAPDSNSPTPPANQQAGGTLFAYVGANFKDPVSEIAALYEQKTGVKVEKTLIIPVPC